MDNEFTRIGKNLFYLPEIRSQTHKTTQDLRTVGAQVDYPTRSQKFIAGSMFIGTAGTA